MTRLLCSLAIALAMHSIALGDLVTNGDFDAGNTGFTSAYSFFSTCSQGGAGTYGIVTNPQVCNGAFASFGDRTGDNGNLMVVNGATDGVSNVWSESFAVAPNTSYTVSTWIASDDAVSPAMLVFSVNGVQVGSTFTASSTAGLWQQFLGTWYSGANGSATLTIVDINPQFGGNDFALDDISFNTTVPEPGSLVLLGAGLLAVAKKFSR